MLENKITSLIHSFSECNGVITVGNVVKYTFLEKVNSDYRSQKSNIPNLAIFSGCFLF